jgi:hypothetical protein
MHALVSVRPICHGLTSCRLASKLTTRPQYAVLKALSTSEKADGDRLGQGKAELRLYEPLLVAEVRVNTDDIVGAVSHAERELSVRRVW